MGSSIKRAKIINETQFRVLLDIVRHEDHALRGEVALRLSFFAALRAGEIAKLRWDRNILDASGEVDDVITITGAEGKRSKGRVIPADDALRDALKRLRAERPDDEFVFYAIHNYNLPRDRYGRATTQHGQVTPSAVVQWFKRLYRAASLQGCTSHSGRRTFITSRMRNANKYNCSIRDIQLMVGHSSLETTAAYIEPSMQARNLVAAWG